jgi:hypothetical protein
MQLVAGTRTPTHTKPIPPNPSFAAFEELWNSHEQMSHTRKLETVIR